MDILCVGHAAWDLSVFVDDFPVENSKCEIRTMLECGGGPAANAAYLLSRWGVSAGIAAAVGDDSYGNRIAADFAAAGADITFLEQNAKNVTPVSVILVNRTNGSRTIINRKAASVDTPFKLSTELPLESPPRVLLLDGHELEASLQALKMFPNAKTILDAGSLREGTRELAKHVDYLVSSERYACQLSGLADLNSSENQSRAIAALYAWNGRPVFITRGEKGVLHGDDQHVELLPAFCVQAVDTTGAGDIFHGAFAYGVFRGLPLQETLRLASAAAAISVTKYGGRSSIPSFDETREMLRHAG